MGASDHGNQTYQKDQNEIELFRSSWSTYKKVLELNYLHHLEIASSFAAELEKYHHKSIRVLDLGCGDCSLPAQLFSLPDAPQLQQFVGVDSTRPALELASAPGLFPAGCSVELVEADMLEHLKACEPGSFDLILSSFAVHHLLAPGKAELFGEAHRALAPGGELLWADVYNSVPGSTRDEAVLGRWRSKFFEGYEGLTQEEREQMWAHASAHDFPEDLPTGEALLRGAGFQDLRCVFTDGIYAAVWVAVKAA